MNTKLTKTLFPLLLVGAVVCVFPRTSNAAIELVILQSNAPGFQQPAPSSSNSVSYLYFSGPIESFSSSSNNPGTNPASIQTSAGIANSTASAINVTALVTQTDFNNPIPGIFLQTIVSSFSSSLGGTVTVTSFADPGNHLFASTSSSYNSPGTAAGTVQGPSLTSAGSSSTSFTATGNYSLTTEMSFALPAGASVMFKVGTMVSTPEPATFAMALAGLPLAGLAYMRRRKSTGQVASET
jgi:hypothetical protein